MQSIDLQQFLHSNTPIETYKANGVEVLVKRDDMMGTGQLPPWGKLLAVRKVLESLDKSRPLLHLSIPQSYSGWALSAFASEYNIEMHIASFTKNAPAGIDGYAEYHRMMPNVLPILEAQTRRLANDIGAQTLPYGFNCEPYKQAMACRISALDVDYSTLVVAAGSGASVAGLTLGARNKVVVAVCCSSVKRVRSALSIEHNVDLKEATFKFTERLIDVTPFPCNPYWDAKAWVWLTQHVHELEQPILFWNLGA